MTYYAAEFLSRITAPCVKGCPAGIDVPRYIGLVEAGRYGDATAVVRERNPFPSVCAYACYRPCEALCRRGLWEAPVAINALKRTATERDDGTWRQRGAQTIGQPTGKRVAIVGSGPAGLTVAYYLGKVCGHEVTVFEASPEAGGQLRTGIPTNRMPRAVIDAELAAIAETRVEIRCNHRVTALADLGSYDAILVAAGTMRPRALDISGELLPGVLKGLDFLSNVNQSLDRGVQPAVGRRVAVIGGGNVAIDCARTARRLGAESVTIYYRRRREDMPAPAFEVRAAELEGVQVTTLVAPASIHAERDHLTLRVVRMSLGTPDASGRPVTMPIPDSAVPLPVDLVISAVGQAPALPDWGLATRPDGTFLVDPDTLATSRRGVFAAGDLQRGPTNIISAIADGRRAAIAIDRYLGGSGEISEVLAPPPGAEMNYPAVIHPRGTPVQAMKELSPADRRNFDLVEQGYNEKEGCNEARRCVRCDLWGAKGVPPAWWQARNLSPFWLGGQDRASQVKDTGRAVVPRYERTFSHAPYIPDEYATDVPDRKSPDLEGAHEA